VSLRLDSPLSALRGVGPKRAAALAEAGCRTVGQLLMRVPVRYEDRRNPLRTAQITAPGPVTLIGRLRKVRAIRLRGRRAMVRAELLDGSGAFPVVWFNRPYLARQLTAPAAESAEYLLHGNVRQKGTGEDRAGLELLNPSCERLDTGSAAGSSTGGGAGERWAPVYRALAPGLGPALLRDLIHRALDQLPAPAAESAGESDPLPEALLRRYELPSLHRSLLALHRPAEDADPEALAARDTPFHRRLIYGELLALQLRLALERERARCPKPHRYRADSPGGAVGQALRAALPFTLTGAQERVLGEIRRDLMARSPMRRLLQGDVGSGKTVVAALAITEALAAGLQAAFMAPTELLAEQHHAVLRRWLGERWRIALLTGSATDAPAARAALAGGEVDLVIGTHALIQQAVELPRLALAVIDEQQRFGVDQRQALLAKGRGVDLLVMTATPIPRSLALTAYGDLDLSVLDELPPGRSPVTTELLPASRRGEVHARLREALSAGARAYAVYPRIEAAGRLRVAAVEREGRELEQVLAGIPTARLHGQLPAQQRAEAAAAFARGEVRVLIATTVIEVGIDVPEATWMLIESAERFGLSQLHQLRGRIGRGSMDQGAMDQGSIDPHGAHCIALHGRLSAEARQRLELFGATDDGFAIAEADLALRGPGELTGTRQAGFAGLAVADPARDRQWLERARADARALLAERGPQALGSLLGDPVD
jgi:ATP-dependent DNA helicase RecG